VARINYETAHVDLTLTSFEPTINHPRRLPYMPPKSARPFP